MQTAVRKSAFGGGKLAEAEITRRVNAGQGRRQILAETGIAASVADKVLADASDREFRSRMRSQRDASAVLQRSILAAAFDNPDRAEAMRSGGNNALPLRLFGAHPLLRLSIEELLDARPVALGRDPCKRCGARGDVGCKHQQAGEVRHV